MEQFLFNNVRFAFIGFVLLGAVLLIIKKTKTVISRTIVCIVSLLLIIFNAPISYLLFLLAGAVLEFVLTTGVSFITILFFVSLALVVIVFPIAALVRWFLGGMLK